MTTTDIPAVIQNLRDTAAAVTHHRDWAGSFNDRCLDPHDEDWINLATPALAEPLAALLECPCPEHAAAAARAVNQGCR